MTSSCTIDVHPIAFTCWGHLGPPMAKMELRQVAEHAARAFRRPMPPPAVWLTTQTTRCLYQGRMHSEIGRNEVHRGNQSLELCGCPCPRAELLVRALVESNSALARHARSLTHGGLSLVYIHVYPTAGATMCFAWCLAVHSSRTAGHLRRKATWATNNLCSILNGTPFAHVLQTIGKTCIKHSNSISHTHPHIYT